MKPVILAGAVAALVDRRLDRLAQPPHPELADRAGVADRHAANTLLGGWSGLKTSLLGAVIGLALLLPFVLLRSLGAGDWKLAGSAGRLHRARPC